MKKTLKSNKGFTLTELLIVIALISILLGVGGPSIEHIMRAQRRKNCAAQMNIIVADINEFYNGTFKGENNIYFTDFLKTDRVPIGVSTTTLEHSQQTAIKNNYATFKKHWICGSYNPTTGQWENAFNPNNDVYEYVYYVDDNGTQKAKTYTCTTSGLYFLLCTYGHLEFYADGRPYPVNCEFPKDDQGFSLYVEYTETGIDDYYNAYKAALEQDAASRGISRDSEIATNEANRAQTKASEKQLPVGYLNIKSTNPDCADIQQIVWINS